MHEGGQPDRGAFQRRIPTPSRDGAEESEGLRLRARSALSREDFDDAEQALRRAITLRPSFVAAHIDFSSLLCRLDRVDEALAFLDHAAADHPAEIWPLSIKAAVLSAERRAGDAVVAHRAVVDRASHAAVPWINYAEALKTIGDTGGAVAAYRKGLERDPENGSCWWGLANLRTIPFGPDDVARMQGAERKSRNPLQQVHLHFALGKGLGDLGRYEESFHHYREANRLRGMLVPYDPRAAGEFVSRSRATFTPSFFSDRSGLGCDSGEVIFIVGMPRSGSTLIEQILASHPMVEGAGELFELQALAEKIVPPGTEKADMPDAIARLPIDSLKAIGERYLQSARRHRRTRRPFFTDKMPANWQLAPLIHLILPNAKIIDVRRNPLACCLSSFSTYFNVQTSFPANLQDLGDYYQNYARLMEHMDAALPGRIYRISYERIVEDLEPEVRRLLHFVGLPFDQACLRFDQTERAIHTPSAQQVRRPIYRTALDQWRAYEAWLAPIKDQLRSI